VKWLKENGGTIKNTEEGKNPEIEFDFLITYDGEGLKELVNGKEFTTPHYFKKG